MGWPRSVLSLSLAIASLLGGVFGPVWATLVETYQRPAITMMVAAAIFISGNFLFASAEKISQSAWVAGTSLLIGIGSAGLGVGILLGAVGRLFPAQDPSALRKRSLVFGIVPALGQTGQFALAPLGRYLIASMGWVKAAEILAWQTFLIVPMILLLRRQKPKAVPTPPPEPKQVEEAGAENKTLDKVQAEPPKPAPPAPIPAAPGPRFETVPEPPSAWLAVKEAFSYLPVVMVSLAYFSCGWTLGFVSTSMAASLQDRGTSADVAAWCVSAIGIGSTVGTLASGVLPATVKGITAKRLLSFVYLFRSLLLFIVASIPPNAAALITVCVFLGLAWFSSIPPTTSLFASICGTRWLGTISTVAFAVHQIGMFLGAYLGSVEYDQRGSYTICWYFTASLSAVAGILVALAKDKSLRKREIVGSGEDYVQLGGGEITVEATNVEGKN